MNQHLSMFTATDQEAAKKELDCYGYLLKTAIELFAQGEFNKALIYHQNIIRSLDELHRMRINKEMHDEAWLLLKQIEARQMQDELFRSFKNDKGR